MRRRKIKKPKSIVNSKVSFIGKTERCPGRIVSFEGTILEDLGDRVKCLMKDNYIYVSDDLFEIILDKKEIKIK